jgi:hypothetical protein
LHCFIKNTKKIVSFIVAFIYLLLVLLEWVLLKTPSCVTLLAHKNNDFICTPIAPPAPEANFHEIVMSTHASIPVDSVWPPSAEVCRAAASFS